MKLPWGELAALAAALCWSVSPILFTLVGRKIGALNINRIRTLLALLFLFLAHTIVFKSPLPLNFGQNTWGWLAVSGVIGLVVGDSLMYKSYLSIGPRKALLMMTLAPLFSVFLAWVFLEEILNLRQIAGVIITMTGVGWVITQQSGNESDVVRKKILHGILLSLGAALCQAVGLILAKKGMTADISPLSVSVVRMTAAFAVLWIWTLAQGKALSTLRALVKPEYSLKLIIGSIIGPFGGVTLSMVAIHLAPVGIASTLCAISPILLIPLSSYFLGDRAGIRGVAGAVVAVSGIALLLAGRN